MKGRRFAVGRRGLCNGGTGAAVAASDLSGGRRCLYLTFILVWMADGGMLVSGHSEGVVVEFDRCQAASRFTR